MPALEPTLCLISEPDRASLASLRASIQYHYDPANSMGIGMADLVELLDP